jgi:ankyrin repeat protein
VREEDFSECLSNSDMSMELDIEDARRLKKFLSESDWCQKCLVSGGHQDMLFQRTSEAQPQVKVYSLAVDRDLLHMFLLEAANRNYPNMIKDIKERCKELDISCDINVSSCRANLRKKDDGICRGFRSAEAYDSNKMGVTPLAVAVHRGHRDAVQTLLELDAKVDIMCDMHSLLASEDDAMKAAIYELVAKDATDNTIAQLILFKTVMRSSDRSLMSKMLTRLLRFFDVNCRRRDADNDPRLLIPLQRGHTLLHVVAARKPVSSSRDDVMLTKMLIEEFRAGCAYPDNSNSTALHIAVQTNKVEVVAQMLKDPLWQSDYSSLRLDGLPADPINLCDNKEETPLTYALRVFGNEKLSEEAKRICDLTVKGHDPEKRYRNSAAKIAENLIDNGAECRDPDQYQR